MADTIVCTPEALLADSGCFCKIPKAQQNQVLIYLLAVMAGGSLDPATLVAQSACMDRVPPEMRKQVITYLLCQLAGGVTPSTCEALSGSGDPTGVTTPDFSGQLYHDTTADSYYRSTGTTSADWVAISGGAPVGNVQGAGDPT